MRVYFYFLLCMSHAFDWAAIDRMGNYGVEYTKIKLNKWLVNLDRRLLETAEQSKMVKSTIAKDLHRAYRLMPRPARDHVRNNTHIYVSKDFILSEAATKHFNASGMYANQTVIHQRGCFFLWKDWKDETRQGGKFISDMEIEIYRFDDYMNYPLNRTNALLHEMAHAWHTMLDLDNVEMIENYQRVNKSRIYENVPYINGVIAPKTYGLQDHRELFASLSVAFLRGYNDYYPFTRRDLFTHDRPSFRKLGKWWRMEPIIEVDRTAFIDGDLPS